LEAELKSTLSVAWRVVAVKYGQKNVLDLDDEDDDAMGQRSDWKDTITIKKLCQQIERSFLKSPVCKSKKKKKNSSLTPHHQSSRQLQGSFDTRTMPICLW